MTLARSTDTGYCGGQGLVEMLKLCATGMRDGCSKCGLCNAYGNRCASNLKPWQNDFHHCLEAFAFGGQAGIPIHMTIANRHGSAGISAEADSIPDCARIQAGGVLVDQIERRLHRAFGIQSQ